MTALSVLASSDLDCPHRAALDQALGVGGRDAGAPPHLYISESIRRGRTLSCGERCPGGGSAAALPLR